MYQFIVKAFKDLSVDELYAILQLRENVFVIEQNCIYNDIDGIDEHCFHVFTLDQQTKKMIAYARLVPANLKFEVPSIGRVINDFNYRGKGLGKALMANAIKETFKLYQSTSIKISAQTYLLKFYSGFGFIPIDAPYDEDGIEHVDMLLVLK